MAWTPEERQERLLAALEQMKEIFEKDPENAVRSQEFIKTFHSFIAEDLRSFLTKKALNAGVRVIEEAKVFGSYKSKDVDVAVVHPTNGPIVMVGVRSQMSSVGKNVLTYYQDIVGEAISIQERFPMAVMGYAYLHPLKVEPWQRKNGTWIKDEAPNHVRYARMYAGIGERDDRLYKHLTGSYDEFAYVVADFHREDVRVRDDIVRKSTEMDLSIETLVPRLVETFHNRNLWVTDIFESPDTKEFPEEAEQVEGLDDTLVTPVDED